MKPIKAWAIACDYCKPFCRHEGENFDIYLLKKEAEQALLAEDGLPNCDTDKVIPVLIMPVSRAAKRRVT
jgi:hypothetical protein